ncbi:molybdopterin molybdotransferase MoeA [Streptomyces sp. NBC_00249]|uniref:molybdopterin molybdotransferase MoeA n=1 Tax=Streptomyces sp. NBC_00249 TaxID=2975690 RepID=UPI00224E2D2E|nr:molybdopterin molybdotransferase MoeA [Streptomyces sp. NBC_00249]MCX5193287.1 molybdopterin molybdotransferase MoeA [Streptomyces sp. NBC_00249]
MPTSTTAPARASTSSATAVSWERARELAYGAAVAGPVRVVPLGRAGGLTLAGELRSPHPLPAFDTAAMDGYAVAGPGPWRVRGEVRAGAAWQGRLGGGEAVGISTGAPVPAGADAVLPLELASAAGGLVSGPVLPPGRHVRRAGEDAPAGAPLAPAGTRVGPALLGLAASCGHDTLAVHTRPRVRVLVTGDELDRTGRPGPGRVRDALGPLLPGLVTELGGEAAGVRYVPDRPAGLLAREVLGVADAEVVVVTGSTSVGATDQLRGLLGGAGARWAVDTVACRPGHPMLLARLGAARRWVVGLPGNPYAALVAAHTLLGPLLAGLSGRRPAPLPAVPVRGRLGPAPGITRLVPVAWEGPEARILAGHGAAFLRGAAAGGALAALPDTWTDGAPARLVLLG